MSEKSSHFRLRSSAFERDDDTNKILPKKVIFLSVEGDETERSYFQNLNEHLDSAIIQIEVLRHRHGDGYSDPTYVIELLEEYINVRNGDLIPDSLPNEFTNKYSKDIVQKYLNNDISLTSTDRILHKGGKLTKQTSLSEQIMSLDSTICVTTWPYRRLTLYNASTITQLSTRLTLC